MGNSWGIDFRIQLDSSDLSEGGPSDSLRFESKGMKLRDTRLALEHRPEFYETFDIYVDLYRRTRQQCRDRVIAKAIETNSDDPFSAAWTEKWDSKVVLESLNSDVPSCYVETFLEPELYDRISGSPHDCMLDLILQLEAKIPVERFELPKLFRTGVATLSRWYDEDEDSRNLPKEALGSLTVEAPALRSTVRMVFEGPRKVP